VAGVSGGTTNVSEQSGLGVRVSNVRRSFDTYLADKSRSSRSDYEMLNDFVSKLSDLENMLLPSGSDLGVFIGRFFEALQDVASNPDSISARTVSLEAGKALVSSFNHYDKQLTNFKTGAIKQVDNKIKEANLYINQLVEVNKLIARSGTKDASNDILDARDKLLSNLSNLLNFTVDYEITGEAIVRIGDSGSGAFLVNRSKGANISLQSDDKNISLIINNQGEKTKGIYSSGIIDGITRFYSLVDTVSIEISNLADKISKEINDIQISGIDLNGKVGKAMFSINSMQPIANKDNLSSLNVNIIENDPSKIQQQNIIVNYSKVDNSWEIRDSNGISKKFGNIINFNGYQVEIVGNPQDGDGFVISPSLTRAGAMKFNLLNPEDFAAASKNLISNDPANSGDVDLNIIGTASYKKNDYPPNISNTFSSSNNPFLSTSFLKDGSVATIPPSVNSINLNSIGNQSSATFTITDADIKGFSSFKISLDNGNEVTLNASASDPGDGVGSVKEFADLLNSGLMLDGKSQHNFINHGLYASGNNGYLTIASSVSDISNATMLAKGNTLSPTISNIPSNSSLASNIQIFTRDGRHVSGTSLNPSEIATLIKPENGFFNSAEYRNDYLNNGYRNINISRKTASGDYVKSFGTNLSYNEQATDMDGLLTSQSVTGGTVTLNGLLSNSKEINSYVTINCEKDESSRTFTVTGYDLDGFFQTDTITGGNVTTVSGSKAFSEVRSISVDSDTAGNISIGTEAVGYTLNIENNDNIKKSINVPVSSNAFYLSEKLNKELAGTGVNVSANTTVILGEFETGTSGSVKFNLKGKNTDPVLINASIDASDVSALAKRINEYSSQTGLVANVSSNFKKIIIQSDEGYDINFKDIEAPSNFYLEVYGSDFEQLSQDNNQKNSRLLIDISDSKKVSANVKGELKFLSSENFTTQINTGLINSAVKDPMFNGYMNISRNKTGESLKIKPEIFNDLDNSLGSEDGKKAVVGLSEYGIDINQKDYKIYVNDNNSLYTSNNPGAAGSISLDGALKDADDLNAVVTIYCSADETGNTFTVTGKDSAGSVISETISGVSSSNTAIGTIKFSSITSIISSANASGNINIGTVGYNDINDDDSLVELTTFSSGVITLDGVLSSSNYLGAQIEIKSQEDTTQASFVISGTNLDNEVITETITGSNAGVVTTSNIFKTVTSINCSGTTNGKIKIGTKAADGEWDTVIDANRLNIDTEKEISTALLTSLRKETPTAQLKGIILNSLPSEGQALDLSFEGQTYTLKMQSGELFVEGSELNRIKARFNGTSDSVQNSIATSQLGVASSAITINGLNSVDSDSDGLVDDETIASAGNFNIDGALSSLASSDLRSTITISSASDNENIIFTITGTDIDGNSQSETITGVNSNTVIGSKFFKTVTQISSNGAANGISVGTNPAYGNDLGTRISISSTQNESNNKFTIVGTGTDGLAKTEIINGPILGKTVSSTGLFKTITSITPALNTSGNVQIGTSPGYELLVTAEGTVEGAQLKVVQTTANTLSAESFGINNSTTTLLGNYVLQPTSSDPAVGIEIIENDLISKYTIKFNNNNEPIFYNSDGASISSNPPSDIELLWTESSGINNTSSIYSGTANANAALILNGSLSTTDDDSLVTSKTLSEGNLVLDGVLSKSSNLNGKITVYCNGDETSNTFTISGYDMSGRYTTDTISGTNSSTALGTVSFSEVLSISVANNSNGTIKIGTQATSLQMDPSIITVDSDGSLPQNRFTIVGLDQFGNSQTEVIEEYSGSTVTGTKVFTRIDSITPSMDSANNGTAIFTIGTKKVGRLSISSKNDNINFKLDSSPIWNKTYGFKTQNIRAVIDNEDIKISSLSGEPVKIDIPENSIKNTVGEKISINNLPSEDLITIIMGNGARKISAEFDDQSQLKLDQSDLPDLTIKVDSTNKNKIEIFDKLSGHSIGSRILDVNRTFDVNNTKFQFSDEPIVNNSFDFSSNKDGFGDNRNLINILNLQNSSQSGDQKGNFQEIFSNTVAKVGSNVQANKLSLDSVSSTLDAAEALQSEFAGVNLDEEAANLLQFQQAYQASARILQTAKEMFQSLIDVV
jgi:flagellar hook-associated protein FlgK